MDRIALGRRLRRDSTDAERRLWQALRSRQVGQAKFRRQRPIGPYNVDFVSLEHRLGVELDGGQHAWQATADRKRDALLARQGYRVLRFWNHDVLNNTEGVLLRIAEALDGEQ